MSWDPFDWIEDLLLDDSEDRHLQLILQLYGESSSTRSRRMIIRDHAVGHERLERDYFASNSVYSTETFRQRFRMRRHVFLRIVEVLSSFDPYFQQRADATGKKGISPLQKCTAAIHLLAYGVSHDVDDYVQIGKSTAIECLKKFVEDVILAFEDEYLRKPNSNDVQRLLQMGEACGFPGMMGSIGCIHWQWENCSKAWKEMYLNSFKGVPTIMLETVVSSDLWIWHAFFGVADSNDINVLDRSPMFDEVLEGHGPKVNYIINSNNYNIGYYVTSDIYPESATFVKTITQPQGDKKKLFAKYQESQRKDVERAFGMLQGRFAFIRGLPRFWHKEDLIKIMKACIILHNMIIEDERDTHFDQLSYDDVPDSLPQPKLCERTFAPYERYIQSNIQLHNREKHQQLQEDLVEHIWQFHNAH